MKKSLILLDRDGVINKDDPHYIKSVSEWKPIAGSLEAIAKLKKAGFTVAIITNQSGIARNVYSEQALTAIHNLLATQLKQLCCAVDAIFYCPHKPEDNCQCRKPKPGMLHQAAHHFKRNFSEMIVIGDSYRDIQAALTVGSKAVLVKTGNGKNVLSTHPDLRAPAYENLAEAVNIILEQEANYD